MHEIRGNTGANGKYSMKQIDMELADDGPLDMHEMFDETSVRKGHGSRM